MNRITLLILPLILTALACNLATNAPQDVPRNDLSAETLTAISTSPAEMFPAATQTSQEAPEKLKSNVCTVLADSLHLRAAPGVTAPIMAYLSKGDKLTLTHTALVGVWIEITTQDGRTGWVNSNYTNCNPAQ